VPRSKRTWPTKALTALAPLVAIDLVIQYIAGVGTNAYAPVTGFTMNTAFGIYNVHWLNGFALGILSIVLVIIAVISWQARNIAPAVVSLVAVLVAGIAGMAFVNSTPNPPWATITMGLAFLVAFGAVMGMTFRSRMFSPATGVPPSETGAPA
jgi:UDP-N-acetylmuramyl pentapeptide phosphotransferase/UDP-N-acetylglucosamine-1-phosphate transferase